MTDAGDRTDVDLGTPRGWSVAAQRHYDPDGPEELTTAIVFAIAEAMGVDPTSVKQPTLYECVDVASLDAALFRPEHGGNTSGSSLEFYYEDFRIEVSDDGWIVVYESAEDG